MNERSAPQQTFEVNLDAAGEDIERFARSLLSDTDRQPSTGWLVKRIEVSQEQLGDVVAVIGETFLAEHRGKPGERIFSDGRDKARGYDESFIIKTDPSAICLVVSEEPRPNETYDPELLLQIFYPEGDNNRAAGIYLKIDAAHFLTIMTSHYRSKSATSGYDRDASLANIKISREELQQLLTICAYISDTESIED